MKTPNTPPEFTDLLKNVAANSPEDLGRIVMTTSFVTRFFHLQVGRWQHIRAIEAAGKQGQALILEKGRQLEVQAIYYQKLIPPNMLKVFVARCAMLRGLNR